MPLADRRAALLDALAAAGGPHERLQAILEHASDVQEVPPERRTDALLVRGCVSRVWLDARVEDGVLVVEASSDAPLVAGLVRVTCEPCLGATPAEVLRSDLDVLAPLGLDRRLSPTRQRGLAAVRDRLRAVAEAGL